MIRYLGRRLLRASLLLLGVSVLSFALFELAPGDYFDELRLNPAVSSQTISTLRQRHGLDAAMPLRYVRWLGSVLSGDWGISVAYNTAAAPLIWQRAGNTLLLTASAAFFAWAIALPLGIWAAAGRRWRGISVTLLTVTLVAVPEVLIVLLLMLLASEFRAVPLGGMHLAVPGTALMLSALPVFVAHIRTAIAEVLDLPFITAARANGVPRLRLLIRHALPAAANPLITLLGLSIGMLLSSGLLVEAIVGWPGLGRLLFEAILERDLYVVVGAVMLSAVLLIAGSLIADLLLYAADPRIREES